MDTLSSAAAICRYEGCGERFTISRHSNQTSQSAYPRKGHVFCSSRCRKAHSRRMAALRIEGFGGVTTRGGSIPAGGVTTLPRVPLQPAGAPQITEWLRVQFEDEAPAIGSGL